MTTETLGCAPRTSDSSTDSKATIGAAMPFIQPSLPTVRGLRFNAPGVGGNIGRSRLQGKHVRGGREVENLLTVGPEAPQRHLALLRLAAAHHGDDRDLGQAVLADLQIDLLVSEI